MSLIQEALRRQQEEQSGTSTGGATQAPAGKTPPPSAVPGPASPSPGPAPSAAKPFGAAVPPPAPPGPPPTPAAAAAIPAQAADAEVASRPWKSFTGVIVLVVALVVAVAALMIFTFGKIKESQDSRRLAINAPASDPTETVEESVLPTTANPARPPAATARPPAQATPAATSQAAPAGPAAVAGTAASLSATGTPPVKAMDWPEITLSGVIGKGIRGAATLNGQIVAVGETIEGAEVVYIDKDGVKLEFGHESRYIKVGQTIE